MIDKIFLAIDWIFNTLNLLRTQLTSVFNRLVKNVNKYILSSAAWGKKQLDKRINTEQRERLHEIINESETDAGRRFDSLMIWIIVASVLLVIAETIADLKINYWWFFFCFEWVFTIIFTIEYILRLYSSKNALKYATSFFGIVDLLAIIPAYLGLFFITAQNLTIIRALRLLRIFRIFKMGHFLKEGAIILDALKASKTKIYVFISFILLMAVLIGSLMYVIEGKSNPALNNIPKGIYWAVVTLTTVGYGDVTPISALGRILATVVMIMGYGVIAVPTGIVTAEISSRVMNMKEVKQSECHNCGQNEHHTFAIYCHKCGDALDAA